MKIPALIMAGGKGKRMAFKTEKPLLTFFGKQLIERVIGAVKTAKKVREFYVVTSKNTPRTERQCLEAGFKVINTDGKGYHDDLRQAILKAKLYCPVLTVSSDLPALTGSFLDQVISIFEKGNSDALTVLVPIRRREELKLSISSIYNYKGMEYAISGINVLNGSKILEEKLDESAIISDEIDAVLNINTMEDLGVAEKLVRGLG